MVRDQGLEGQCYQQNFGGGLHHAGHDRDAMLKNSLAENGSPLKMPVRHFVGSRQLVGRLSGPKLGHTTERTLLYSVVIFTIVLHSWLLVLI